MKTAEAFHRDDFARAQPRRRFADWIFAWDSLAACLPEFRVRPAIPARIWLRVEPPVFRVVIFGAAAFAHLERGHGSLRPVVRDAAHDGEARPAIRTVDEGIE